jgi:hypothetical protein
MSSTAQKCFLEALKGMLLGLGRLLLDAIGKALWTGFCFTAGLPS